MTEEEYLESEAAKLATLRGKAEALDRLDVLVRSGWLMQPCNKMLGTKSIWLIAPDGFITEGPSLLEAINALPISSEEK